MEMGGAGRGAAKPAPRGAWQREPRTVVRAGGLRTGPAPFAITIEEELSGVPLEWEPHEHEHHELVWAHGGALTTRIEDRIFTVSEGSALWLPAGVWHSGRITGHITLFTALFVVDRTPLVSEQPRVLRMTPLLEALLGRLARSDLSPAARRRAEAVVFDVLEPAAEAVALELPGDPRIDPIAEALLADPADRRDLGAWARTLGVSERTIARAFRSSTGLSFGQWRQALRIHRAIALLAGGHEVAEAAELLGYPQPSTFIAAFKRVMGVTPGVHAERARNSEHMS